MDEKDRKAFVLEIDTLVTDLKKAQYDSNAAGHIPLIIKGLEWMSDHIDLDGKERQGYAGGFAKVVMDDPAFSDSPLGARAIEVIKNYRT